MHVLHRPVEPADIIIHIIWALTYRRTPRDLASHCRLVCGAFMPRKLRHLPQSTFRLSTQDTPLIA